MLHFTLFIYILLYVKHIFNMLIYDFCLFFYFNVLKLILLNCLCVEMVDKLDSKSSG